MEQAILDAETCGIAALTSDSEQPRRALAPGERGTSDKRLGLASRPPSIDQLGELSIDQRNKIETGELNDYRSKAEIRHHSRRISLLTMNPNLS